MKSKSFVTIGLGAVMTGVAVIALLASCAGAGTTVTKTVPTTVGGGGAGGTVTQTVTTSAGGGSGNVMGNIVIYGDTISNVGCLETNTGHRGELLVFRARIVDPETGKDMTDKDVVAGSAEAVLPDGEKFPMAYGGHPGGGTPTDYFWSVAWEVPLTYPTGTLGYSVVATANDGRTGTFAPFVVSSSQLTIKPYDVNYVRAWTANITATGFSVPTLTISQGAKVTFTNKDTIPHTIVGPDWNSGSIAAAGTYVQAFNTAGTFVIKDSANPAFTMTIIVNAAS